MGHNIEGFIFNDTNTAEKFAKFEHSKVIKLNQGFLFVPLTNELFDEIGNDGLIPYELFWKFSGKIEKLIKMHSHESSVMYIETDYHGGTGEQACAIWRNGELYLKPEVTKIGGISKGLQLMNATKKQSYDEFEAIGLSKFRSNADWIEYSNC